MVNDVKFHTRDLDNRRVTQNGGVCTEGDYEGEMHDFYGNVCKIWKFEYMFFHKVVLFQCEWYNTGTNGRRRMIRTNYTAQALMFQVGGMKMTILYFLVKRDKFFTFKIPN